jgi:hypothetical protein
LFLDYENTYNLKELEKPINNPDDYYILYKKSGLDIDDPNAVTHFLDNNSYRDYEEKKTNTEILNKFSVNDVENQSFTINTPNKFILTKPE